MAIYPILTEPDPRLRQKSLPVSSVGEAERQLLADMLETLYAADGLGLAAPQIGILKRVVVMDLDYYREGGQFNPRQFINPEIVWRSEEKLLETEGCLSVPEVAAKVERSAEVKVKYLDPQGQPQELHATGILAICLQHELDHLDGILYIDHLSPLKRNMLKRRLQKNLRYQPEPA